MDAQLGTIVRIEEMLAVDLDVWNVVVTRGFSSPSQRRRDSSNARPDASHDKRFSDLTSDLIKSDKNAQDGRLSLAAKASCRAQGFWG